MLIRLNKLSIGFILLLILIPIFGQIIPRIYLISTNSEYKKDAFLNYAIGTNERNYTLVLGTQNTGITVKHIERGNIQRKICLHENSDILLVTLQIHGWFGIPNGEATEVNCK
jgi:hypothetical protein